MAKQTFVIGDVTIQCIVEERGRVQATVVASAAAIDIKMSTEQTETVGNLFLAMAQASRRI